MRCSRCPGDDAWPETSTQRAFYESYIQTSLRRAEADELRQAISAKTAECEQLARDLQAAQQAEQQAHQQAQQAQQQAQQAQQQAQQQAWMPGPTPRPAATMAPIPAPGAPGLYGPFPVPGVPGAVNGPAGYQPPVSMAQGYPMPTAGPQPRLPPPVSRPAPEWQEVRVPDGRVYYYNANTGEKTWVRPY